MNNNPFSHKLIRIFFTCLMLAIAFMFYSGGDKTVAIPEGIPKCESCIRRAIIDRCTVHDPSVIIVEDGQTEVFCISSERTIGQSMTNKCFFFLNTSGEVERFKEEDINRLPDWYKEKIAKGELPPLNKPTFYLEPEYAFEMDFVSGLSEYYDEGRTIQSKWTIKMFFLGEQREFVHQWQTTGTYHAESGGHTDWRAHQNKFRNAYKEGDDINEIIAAFEKKPTYCKIKPEKESVGQNEVIDITINDIKDDFGQQSREFNRLMVHAYHGNIQNGKICKLGPDYKVFKVDDGEITLKYKAPDDCEVSSDRISVYNTCEILPEDRNPIEETRINRLIDEKNIKISCYDGTLTLRKEVKKKIFSERSEVHGKCKEEKIKRHQLDEQIQTTVFVPLKLKQATDMPIYGQRWEYYMPVNINLRSFNLSSKEVRYSYSNINNVSCASGGHETTVTTNTMSTKNEIEQKNVFLNTPWIVVFDNKTNKAVKIIPAGYSIGYDTQTTEKMETALWSKDGRETDQDSDAKEGHNRFALGPVADKVTDPTVKSNKNWMQDYLKQQGIELPPGVDIPQQDNKGAASEIPSDILVSFGDGVTHFGGKGEKRDFKKTEFGYEDKNQSFHWEIKLRKKQ